MRKMQRQHAEAKQKKKKGDLFPISHQQVMLRHWNKPLREVVKSPSLGMLKRCVNVALGDTV